MQMSRTGSLLLGVWFSLVACGGTPDNDTSHAASGGSGGRAHSAPIQPRCLEALEAGNCDASATRYAFDASRNECVPVARCDGTPNQFGDVPTCQAACQRETLECPSAVTMSGQPCTQPGAGCSNFNMYGYYGGCMCLNGAWFCNL